MDPKSLIANAGWLRILGPEFEKPYFKNLWEFVSNSYRERVVYPAPENIFRAFNFVAPEEVKVVIIGQDPYHGPQQADGLCFSAGAATKMPPSLRNIFKALGRDLTPSVLETGDLTKWAGQGVLLLNTVLTVEAAKAGSHQRKGWETFTDQVIRIVSGHNSGCVFLCWGAAAQKKCSMVDGHKHLVLSAVHPSPLAAYRGFLDCGHFSLANSFLKSIGKGPICW